MTNTKLSPEQKRTRRVMRDSWFFKGGALFFFGALGVTVAIRRTGATMGEFAASIASTGEKVARRKVGEFVALERTEFGNLQPLRLAEKLDADGAADFGFDSVADAERATLNDAARTVAESLADWDNTPNFTYKGQTD
jgi:hypothetical protein